MDALRPLAPFSCEALATVPGAWGCLPKSMGVGGGERIGIGRAMAGRKRGPSASAMVRRALITTRRVIRR